MQRWFHETLPPHPPCEIITKEAASEESDPELFTNDGYYWPRYEYRGQEQFLMSWYTDLKLSIETTSRGLHLFRWHWSKWKNNIIINFNRFLSSSAFSSLLLLLSSRFCSISSQLLYLQLDWKTRTCNYLITFHFGWLNEKGSLCLGHRLLQCIINCPISS